MTEIDERTKATISAAVVLVINLLALFGVSLNPGLVLDVALGIVTIGATLYAAWKNHNFTPEAIEAQAYLDDLKKIGGYDA